MKRLFDKTFALLASFGFAVVLLFWLLVLTWWGTLEQTHMSLYEVQKKYFDSFFLTHDVLGVPVPLPGVHLLLVLLGVNLIAGGIVRIRKGVGTVGILVAHLGIVLMLMGSLVEFHSSQKGHTTLLEGTRGGEFQSYVEWEIAISDADATGGSREHVIPGKQFIELDEGAQSVFQSSDLPFDLVVSNVAKNARVVAGNRAPMATATVDGYALFELPQTTSAESDVAGCVVTIRPKGDAPEAKGLLWAAQRGPWSVEVDGRRFTVDLQRRRWALPFDVILDDFRKVDHPGITMAKAYESDIRKVEGGVEEPVTISMNAPLRHKGYTLYQSSFAGPFSGGRFRSTFAVVRNPADQIPLYSCIIITVGLLFHFGRKLMLSLRREARKQAA